MGKKKLDKAQPDEEKQVANVKERTHLFQIILLSSDVNPAPHIQPPNLPSPTSSFHHTHTSALPIDLRLSLAPPSQFFPQHQSSSFFYGTVSLDWK